MRLAVLVWSILMLGDLGHRRGQRDREAVLMAAFLPRLVLALLLWVVLIALGALVGLV